MISTAITKERTKAASQKVKERDYWLNQLSGEWQKTTFFYDHYDRHDVNGSRGMEYNDFGFSLTGENFSDLIQLSNGSDHRLFMILAAQLVVLLYKYTGNTDIVLGAPIYRQKAEGNFVNTVLTLRNRIAPEITFKQLLLQVRQVLVEATEHQNYPIEALLHKLDRPFSTENKDDFPLFDIGILLDNVHKKDYINHIPTNLNFNFHKSEHAVDVVIEYNPARYYTATIEQIARHYGYLVRYMMASLDSRLAEIQVLSEDEKKQVLFDFNETSGEYPSGKTIHRLFSEQAERTPDNIALLGESTGFSASEPCKQAIHVSYRELNKKSNQLAKRLRENGVKPDIFAAIIVDRSIEMMIGILAILKAGGAYLPIDPNYPPERKTYMLADSDVRLLLTNLDRGALDYIPAGIEIVDIDIPALYRGDGDNLPGLAKDSNLVYLVYTSGSTGTPKGVMLEHKNVVNLIHFDLHHTNLDFSKVLQFHTIGFDASFHEIFCALLSGGLLVLIDEGLRLDIGGLFKFVERNCVPTLFLPMSFLRIIFNEESYADMFPGCVRHIQTAGEQVVINHRLRRFLQENQVYFHNHYGPAETHVVTTLTLDPGEDIPELPAIGKPILNTRIYILDKAKQLLPVGVPGELYIGGIQVGRGYWQREELTEEVFITSPFREGERLYKSGDLGRWSVPADGNIEFLGRIDTQVKIRGFRVEPGEIESRLMDIDYIKEAVVIASRDKTGEMFLGAYVVSAVEINAAELRDILLKTLPDYMIPAYFIRLEKIPLSPNGKVKRDALPSIEAAALKKAYAAPRDAKEENLCQLWSEVLGLEKSSIGIDDNFFESGGHSLKATILITKIYKSFGVKLILGELFNHPTIKGLAQLIKEDRLETFNAIAPVEKKEYYPMSSAQKRMYIINQLEKESISYNMPSPMLLEETFNKEKFAAICRELILRQEGLRTRFIVIGGEPVQRIEESHDIEFAIEYTIPPPPVSGQQSSHAGTLQEKYINPFVRPFDLSRAPLFRVGVVKLEQDRHLFMVDLHHIIGDGVCIGVLIREFTQMYEGEVLVPLRIQYRDYAVWQQGLAKSGELKRQEEYWLKQLDNSLPPLQLPLDYPRPAVMSFAGRWVDFEISSEVTGKLKLLAEKNEATLFMVLLAAYSILLHKYTGQETIVVGSAIAGRSYPDLESIIGVFLNTLAIKSNPYDHLSFTRFLLQVKENALRAYENQDYQFEELVEKLEFKRDYSRNPIFDTMLNFINMDIPGINLSDLKLTPYKMESSAVKLDIKINAWEEGGKLCCTVDYASGLFKPDTMDTFIENLKMILQKIVEDPGIKISGIQLISEEKRKEMISDFSADLDYEF